MRGEIVFEKNSALRAALRLEIITIIWMVIEAAVAFGIDSAIELASAVVVFRRLRIESCEEFVSAQDDARSIERKTARIAGYLLFLLSAYVLVQAVFGL